MAQSRPANCTRGGKDRLMPRRGGLLAELEVLVGAVVLAVCAEVIRPLVVILVLAHFGRDFRGRTGSKGRLIPEELTVVHTWVYCCVIQYSCY